jgi:predicted permease
MGKMANKNSFSNKFDLDKKDIKKRYLIRACFITQLENIKNNNLQIQKIYKNKTKKAQYINRFVDQFENKNTLISAIKKTLRMASVWDFLFAMFLKLRFPHWFIIKREFIFAKVFKDF